MVLPSDRTYPAVATPIHGNPLHDAVSRQMDLAMEARLARSADALAQLELLLGLLPPALHVVLATRRHPQLGLHRLRLAGELAEVRAADLRFTLETRDRRHDHPNQPRPGHDSRSTLMPPTSQHMNLPPLVEGPAVELAGRHAKVRREGYRRRRPS
jgi:hypothetical protein